MIKQSVINTFKRVGIDYEFYKSLGDEKAVLVSNRFSGETRLTTPLILACVQWVYKTSNDYEDGKTDVRLSDFDRVRYFILETDKDVYYTCID